jgi:hypothetical protein
MVKAEPAIADLWGPWCIKLTARLVGLGAARRAMHHGPTVSERSSAGTRARRGRAPQDDLGRRGFSLAGVLRARAVGLRVKVQAANPVGWL